MDVPELTEELLDTIVAQSDEQADGLSVRDLERRRDDNLVAILQALRSGDDAAGRLLREHEERLLDAAADAIPEVDESEPLRLHGEPVRTDWVDYNGHMTESRYLDVLANASDAFLRHVELNASYLEGGHSLYTAETHIRHLAEAHASDRLDVETQVLAADEKRLHLFHTVRNAGSGTTVATGEHMLLHVDTGSGRVCPMVEPLAGRIGRLASLHAGLPVPEGAGRYIGQPR
jgi:carnitine 3-dehydrogenase